MRCMHMPDATTNGSLALDKFKLGVGLLKILMQVSSANGDEEMPPMAEQTQYVFQVERDR